MDNLSDPERQVLAAAERFAKTTIGPSAEEWDTAGRIPADVYRLAGDEGLCRLIVPVQSGGHGLSACAMARVMETLARACFASAFSLVVHNNLTAALARSVLPAPRERYLPDLLAGRRVGAFLLTEPQGGSDAGAIQTRAERVASGWRISGEKAWVSNGAVADTLSVYAQTDPGLGSRGIACFLLDAGTSGIHRKPAYRLLGGHALATAGFEFDGCAVEDDDLLIPPGEGFRAAMQGIDIARINVAAMCAGILSDSLEVALEFSGARQAFGQSVLDFQGIQWMLADAATDLEAARLLAFHAARLRDLGQPATVAAAHAKKFATRVALTRISDCMQTMGAWGYSREYPLARHLAAARMSQYLDGTTEIQNVVISRSLRGASAP